VEVRLQDGSLLILDAGSGMRDLGRKLRREKPASIHILLTHLHLDHLLGLGFFAPLFMTEVEVNVWGPASTVDSLEHRLTRYMSPPLFPVYLEDVPSRLYLHDVPEAGWEIGSAHILADPIQHNGPTLGYRIEERGRSLVYLPDHEPALGTDIDTVGLEWISAFRLMHEADVMLHDSQYTRGEYLRRTGFGHSSIEHTVALSKRAEVKRLILFHHDPGHNDADLEAMLLEARQLWGSAGNPPALAYEGMVIDI